MKQLRLIQTILDSPATYPLGIFYLVACLTVPATVGGTITLAACMIILTGAVVVLTLIAFMKSLHKIEEEIVHTLKIIEDTTLTEDEKDLAQ